MSSRCEVRLSGEGGQGLVLAGKILAEAAAIYEDRNAVQSQSYGPEARGGASKSDVIISDDDIDDVKAESLDLLLALTQESLETYLEDLKPGGWLVIDGDHVTKVPEGDYRIARVRFDGLARETIGKAIVANIIALGAIVRISKVVSVEAAEKAILSRVPRGTEDLNRRAFAAGLQAADAILAAGTR